MEFMAPVDLYVTQIVLMNISEQAPASHSPHCRPATRAPFVTFLLLMPASERRENEEERVDGQRNTVC